mmetsp:Transcript_63040/g.124588  ORF Transcript_63040/g.124588 Transcript_63040/m.124588 type:complete len:83 (+) Transcript_63040:64-312(+)
MRRQDRLPSGTKAAMQRYSESFSLSTGLSGCRPAFAAEKARLGFGSWSPHISLAAYLMNAKTDGGRCNRPRLPADEPLGVHW